MRWNCYADGGDTSAPKSQIISHKLLKIFLSKSLKCLLNIQQSLNGEKKKDSNVIKLPAELSDHTDLKLS